MPTVLDVSVTEYRHLITPHEMELTRDKATISTLRRR